MKKKITILKHATRSVLDYCLLPGTSTGAEIVWLYSLQWKNRLSIFMIALVSIAYLNMQVAIEDTLLSKSANEPESTR